MTESGPIKHSYLLKDDPCGEATELPLLSVSMFRGIVPRSEITDKEPRADNLCKYKLVSAGDLVINRMSAYQGALGLARQNGIVSPEYIVLQPAPSVDGRYLTYLFKSKWFVSQMALRVRGIGSLEQGNVRTPRINPEDLGMIPVALPLVDEQKTIADYLDAETARIDALINKKQRMLTALQVRASAQQSRLILQGMDPITGEGTLPPNWRLANLGILIALQRGHDLPSQERFEGEVPVVSSGGVSGRHNVAVCAPPGVVTGRYGTIGEVFWLETPYWPLNTTLYVKDFRGNDPRWVYHLLRALPLNFDEEKSAVTGISRNVVGQLRVGVPSLTEQQEIAGRLDRSDAVIDELLRKLDEQLALLREHRQALITAAVTGKTKIPGATT